MRNFTLKLLAAMICASTYQPSYAQQPPRLTATAAYYYKDASTGFYPMDSTYYQYNLPNAYNTTKKAWLFEAEINKDYNDVTNAFDQDNTANYYTYDNNGNVTAKIEMSYSTKWDTVYQTYITYNSNNQKTTETFKSGSTSETWKNTYTYDGSNNLIEKIEQKLDNATSIWGNLYRETYTYSGGKKATDIYFEWLGGQWQSQIRSIYHYKGSLADTILNQFYDASTGTGSNKELITMTYTVNNDMDTLSYFNWQSGSWVGTKRYSQTFDNKHNLLTYTRQAWFSNAWNMNNRDSSVYNAANLPITVISDLRWNNATSKFEYSNDNTELRHFYYQDATYVNDYKTVFSALKVYPNPAWSVLTIQLNGGFNKVSAFTIYDVTGQAVKHWNEIPTKQYSRTIDITDLQSGQYILRINGEKLTYQRFTILRSK